MTESLEMITHHDSILITVKVAPSAQKPGISGLHGGMLKIAVKAVPEKGKANQEVIDLLANQLGIVTAQLEIHSGHTSRQKRVRIQGLSTAEVNLRLTGKQ